MNASVIYVYIRLAEEKKLDMINIFDIDTTAVTTRTTENLGQRFELIASTKQPITNNYTKIYAPSLVHVKSVLDIYYLLNMKHISDCPELNSILSSTYKDDFGHNRKYCYSTGFHSVRLVTYEDFCRAIKNAKGFYRYGKKRGQLKHSPILIDKLLFAQDIWKAEININKKIINNEI